MSDYGKLTWRVGGKVPLNVYEGDTPMFQCHTPEQAARVVKLLNAAPGLLAVVAAAGVLLRQVEKGYQMNETPECWALRSALAKLELEL